LLPCIGKLLWFSGSEAFRLRNSSRFVRRPWRGAAEPQTQVAGCADGELSPDTRVANLSNHGMDPQTSPTDGYEPFYRQFDSPLMRQIRREAYGEDVGQHSWVSAADLREDVLRLELAPASRFSIWCGLAVRSRSFSQWCDARVPV
jgi:hypothetical protein